MARIPPKQVSRSDRDALRNLERDLKLVVFGQDEAIEALAAAIKMSRSGLGEEDKPIGSFMFSGPTGVGKTEVTRQLAMIMGIELIRFDMSEYMEAHSVSRLVGAPPGYVGFDQGGLLTEAVTKTPHAVLLLDEIDRFHPPGPQLRFNGNHQAGVLAGVPQPTGRDHSVQAAGFQSGPVGGRQVHPRTGGAVTAEGRQYHRDDCGS